jgi:hypothetical protein
MRLHQIQAKWFDAFKEIEGIVEPNCLAAPFFSVRERFSEISHRRTILLVGKATAGDWNKDAFRSKINSPLRERMHERRCATLGQLERMRNRPFSAFWRFWKGLHEFSPSVVWTNLAKIGMVSSNPSGDCLKVQSKLAIETLQAEIEEYDPKLIIVTGEYATNEILYPIWPKGNWKGARDPEYCWIKKTHLGPPVLWVDHPERKRIQRIHLWVEKVRELL